jgi:hypothetical protein
MIEFNDKPTWRCMRCIFGDDHAKSLHVYHHSHPLEMFVKNHEYLKKWITLIENLTIEKRLKDEGTDDI